MLLLFCRFNVFMRTAEKEQLTSPNNLKQKKKIPNKKQTNKNLKTVLRYAYA